VVSLSNLILGGIPGILPGQLTNAWPYGTSMSSLYRLPTLAPCHDWNKNLPGASNNADLATRSLLQPSGKEWCVFIK